MNSRARTLAGLVVGVLCVAMVAACSGTGVDAGATPDDPVEATGPALWATLTADGFDLAWDGETEPPTDTYDLGVRTRSRIGEEWVDDGDWTVEPVRGTHLAYTDVEPDRRYLFRVRGANGEWSPTVERQFVVPSLPVIRLATDDGDPMLHGRGTYRAGTFALQPDATGEAEPELAVQIRGRGNSTWRYVRNKKPFQIQFPDEVALLDMAPSRRWVLLANAFDRSQLRTWTAFELARATDLEWVPSCDWVELIFNGDYRGVYQLCEKIEVAPDKVDLDQLAYTDTDPEDITGGYLLELGSTPAGSKRAWDTAHTGKRVALYRPKDPNDDQLAYIRHHLDQLEEALTGPRFTDPDDGYRAWIDTRSLIDYWIVHELTLDDDGFLTSTYIHKKRGDDRVYFGPVWDFDKSMGSDFSRYAATTEGWLTMHPDMMGASSRGWIVRAFEDPTFVAEAERRWNELLPELEKIPDRVRAARPELERAKQHDLLRWADEVDSKWEFRYGDEKPADAPDAIADWLEARMAWITDHLGTFDSAAAPGPKLPLAPRRG